LKKISLDLSFFGLRKKGDKKWIVKRMISTLVGITDMGPDVWNKIKEK